jgi:hypothetical protein
MLVARSRDGGRIWGPITTLIQDPQDVAFNDKNTLTADPTNSRFAYAVWDRLSVDVWVTRSRDSGRTFGDRERVTPASFDLRQAPFAGGFFVGDYTGLASAGGVFHPAFCVSTGAGAANPTDTLSAQVTGPVIPATAAALASRVATHTARTAHTPTTRW